MSRNVRQKNPRPPPAKVSKRRGSDTSAINLSGDDGYSAVEEISDSEDDDEENVNAAEEEHIILQKSRARAPASSSRPPTTDQDEDEEEDDDEGADEDEDNPDDENDADVEVDDNASWDGIVSEETGESSGSDAPARRGIGAAATTQRHVRFADVPSSDSDSTETEDDHADFFPDLFVEQSSLDPGFRREIEDDEDESSTSSFWDFYGQVLDHSSGAGPLVRAGSDDDTPTATPGASHDVTTGVSTPVPVDDDSQELDGYESDGDTTEEDVPEPVVRRKTRRAGQCAESSDSDSTRLVRFRPGKPRLGSFDLNSSDRKPIAVVNPISRKMMIFTPYRRHQLDLSPEQFDPAYWTRADEQSSPILTNPGGVMMGAMFASHTFGDFMNTQAVGPAEAFFPLFTPNAHGVDESSDSAPDDGGDEVERSLNISDFITWEGSESSDDEDGNNEEAVGDWPNGGESPSVRRQSTTGSDGDVLAHLNADTVGAFRRNQLNQQLIYSSKATQDSLAFSGPYNLTALRGLKADRFQTAAAPLTPMRRQRKGAYDASRSPLESVSQKRKASGEPSHAHKRQRSISDVNLLQI